MSEVEGANSDLVPFVSRANVGVSPTPTTNPLIMTDQGDTDLGEQYIGSILSRPLMLGQGSRKFGIRAATIVAKAVDESAINISLIRDFGIETNTVQNISLEATASESRVFVPLDNSRMSQCKAFQLRFEDYSNPNQNGLWELDSVVVIPRPEEGQ